MTWTNRRSSVICYLEPTNQAVSFPGARGKANAAFCMLCMPEPQVSRVIWRGHVGKQHDRTATQRRLELTACNTWTVLFCLCLKNSQVYQPVITAITVERELASHSCHSSSRVWNVFFVQPKWISLWFLLSRMQERGSTAGCLWLGRAAEHKRRPRRLLQHSYLCKWSGSD